VCVQAFGLITEVLLHRTCCRLICINYQKFKNVKPLSIIIVKDKVTINVEFELYVINLDRSKVC